MYVPAPGPVDESNPFGVPPLEPEHIREIEGDFWLATPELSLIAAQALASDISPWGVLGPVLTNTAARIPFWVELPTKAGTPGALLGDGASLNFACITVGESGENKSESVKVARGIQPASPNLVTKGTSAGWVKKFVKNTTDEAGNPIRERLLYSMQVEIDEMSGLMDEFARSGSQTSSSLREMVMGTMTGNVTGESTRDNWLKAGSYRFGIHGNGQPECQGALYTDEEIAAGTPQRMLNLPCSWDGDRPGVSQNAAKKLPPMPVYPDTKQQNAGKPPKPFEMSASPLDEELPPPFHIQWAPACVAEVQAERKALEVRSYFPTLGMDREQRERHKSVVVQRHIRLLRIKVSALLAAMHGRLHPTDLDWALSGTVIRVHLGMTAGILQVIKEQEQALNDKQGNKLGQVQTIANEYRQDATDKAVHRVAGVIWAQMVKKGRGMTHSGMSRAPHSRDRQHAKAAINLLADNYESGKGQGIMANTAEKGGYFVPTLDGFPVNLDPPRTPEPNPFADPRLRAV